MPSLASVRAPDRRTVVVPWSDDAKVTLTYDRNVVTPELVARLQAAEGEGPAELAVVDVLAHLLVEWDITETDDPTSPRVPITTETLASLPSAFIGSVMVAIQEDNRPPEQSVTSFSPG